MIGWIEGLSHKSISDAPRYTLPPPLCTCQCLHARRHTSRTTTYTPTSRSRHASRSTTYAASPQRLHTPRTPPCTRTRPPLSLRPTQTPIMHHLIPRQRRHHAPPQSLMTYPTHPLIRDHHPPIPAPMPARHAIAQQQRTLRIPQLTFLQPGNYARFIDDAVGGADASLEIRF